MTENTAEPLASVEDAVKLIALTALILRTHGRNLRTGVKYPKHLTPDLEIVADGLSRAHITLAREPAEADADLVALRSAEDEALDLLLRSYVPDEDDARRYRDAVATRVRAEEAERRAAPREPGEDMVRLTDVMARIAEASLRYGGTQESWLVGPRQLTEDIRALAAPRPDAGDGTGEP